MSGTIASCPLRGHVDPRLVRFSSGATAVVLAIVLVTVDAVRPLAIGLLASQVAVFAFTGFVSFQWSVWAQLFARWVWPRLDPPVALLDARPPRRAQLVGLALVAPALVCFVAGVDAVAYALTALVLGATALNAFTGVPWAARPADPG